MMNYDELKSYLESIGGLKYPKWRSVDETDSFNIITDPHFFEIESGWYVLVKDLIAKLIELGWDKEIHQVKQKYGGLRFYTGATSDEMRTVIREYENLSYKTCEVCGEPGEVRPGGWIETLCDTHYDQTSV
jgi:hypothetical protein